MTLTWAFHVDSVEFTPGVIAGTESLGGSESACLGLARALVARGHDVSIFTTQLHKDAPEVDHAGVRWYPSQDVPHVSRFTDWDVFVALRLPHVFHSGVRASLRLLWNQDLMTGEAGKLQTMGLAWAYDRLAYVSQYHRKQWEGIAPELAPFGWVTKNGYDPSLVPATVTKRPTRIIHISRPERGLRPLLAMWPELRRRVPDAELAICRYNSMYDASGWGRVCAAYDDAVKEINAKVGGIAYLGELGKPALYQAIAESAVMWYPGVADFAETSCIAAIEAQACGTPFVGSYKGALPETVPHGVLVRGDADTPEYQLDSLNAVERILRGDHNTRFMVDAGRQHVRGYTYDVIAAEWEAFVLAEYDARLAARKLARLLHEDDHCAAQVLAQRMGDTATADWCQYVIDGKDQGAEDYAARALDPREEMRVSQRVAEVVKLLDGSTRILDAACGNGAFAIALAKAYPAAHIVAVDYAQGNIDVARTVAAEEGVADRITFVCAPVYDYTSHQPSADLAAICAQHGPFDGVFVGEFLEHVAGVTPFLTAIHAATVRGARIVVTMPSGAFGELAQRDVPLRKGHVHHFRPRDLHALLGGQDGLDIAYLEWGVTFRGSTAGQWIVSYRTNGAPVGTRDLDATIRVARPKYTLSVGILVHDTTDLWRCLESIWAQADEIVLGDTGAKPDDLARIVEAFPKTRVVPVGRVHDLPGGFAEARNTVLSAATGDWFLWIDTDERLVGAERLWRYLDGGVFRGYGLKQNHLMLDTPNTFDTPIRLFKRGPDIQFYGCIHEQPQMGHCNGDIVPALQLNDAEIAHTGYLNESIRRDKALERNLPLLVRDQEMFPDRRLGKVLVLRDCLNLAVWNREEAAIRAGVAPGGKAPMTPDAKRYYQQVITLFETHFADPADKYHPLARPFYEMAIKEVAGAMEVELAFLAQPGGLKMRAKPVRFWVRTGDQLKREAAYRMAEYLKPLEPAPPLDVEPMEVRDVVGA